VYLDACLCTVRDGMGTGVQISERSVLMVKSFRGSRVESCRKSSGVPRGRLWRGVLLAAWVLPVLMSGEPLIRFQKRSLALRMRR
jgi:hypothetical protein